MSNGFINLPFRVASTDGRNFVLLEDQVYFATDGTRYVMPAFATTDGASTPPVLWQQLGLAWIPPFGSYWPAAVLHDCAFRDTLLVEVNGVRTPAHLTEAESNQLLDEAMTACGTHDLTKWNIFKGVCLAGASSFDDDRAKGAAAFMAPVPPSAAQTSAISPAPTPAPAAVPIQFAAASSQVASFAAEAAANKS